MSLNKRDRLQIIFDILLIIRNSDGNLIRPTPLLRFSNLSFKSFSDYESELLEKGFIVVIFDKKGKKFFSLSKKGFEYIEKYVFIRKFIEDFEL